MKVVVTSFRVLEEVALGQPVGVSEIARRLGLPKSTVQRALETLADEHWIEQEPEGGRRWIQTPKLLALASRGRSTSLRELALPTMRWLLDQTNENVHLNVRQGENIVIVEKLESGHSVRVFDPLGTVVPLHASSSGKAILAWVATEELKNYMERGLPAFTSKTITDAGVFRAELAHIREIGYAFNRGEWRSEIRAVAAAIRDTSGAPRAAVSISAPKDRISKKDVPSLGALVRAAAEQIGNGL